MAVTVASACFAGVYFYAGSSASVPQAGETVGSADNGGDSVDTISVLYGGEASAASVSGYGIAAVNYNAAEVANAAADSGYYELPVRIPVFLSGNVGELRGNHFHSGIDIKTQGVVGKPIYSIAQGYVSRIGVSPTGFGLVLYVQHTNGTTSVYGHLDKFIPEIAQYVRAEQYRRKSYSVDLYPDKVKFPVEQGTLIAYSGDTGSSGGPHLHFEVRDASQQPYNILANGMYNFADTIAPRVVNLYYVSIDTVQGVPVHTRRQAISIPAGTSRRYTVPGGAAVKVAPNGYFAAEISERKNGTDNVFAIYSLDMRLDGTPVFDMALDKVNFNTTRYSQAVAQHPESQGKRNGVYRIMQLPNNPLPIYKNMKNKGVIALRDDAVHDVEIEACDDLGNSSTLYFKIQRTLAPATPAGTGTPAIWNSAFTHSADGVTVTVPARALYESVLFTAASRPQQTGMYSQVYDLFDAEVPLQSSITVAVAAPSLPERLHSKALIGRLTGDRRSSAGGSWKNGRVETTTSSFGSFYVAVDTIPPRIIPSFTTDENLASKNSVSFVITDDFSGISSYSTTVDGQWELFEYSPSSNRITHYFTGEKPGTKHAVVLTVTDAKGNSSTFRGSFIR